MRLLSSSKHNSGYMGREVYHILCTILVLGIKTTAEGQSACLLLLMLSFSYVCGYMVHNKLFKVCEDGLALNILALGCTSIRSCLSQNYKSFLKRAPIGAFLHFTPG